MFYVAVQNTLIDDRGGAQVGYCLEAADRLKEEGISAEVINLRSLKPLDRNTVLDSVRKTHRCAPAPRSAMHPCPP